MLACADPPRDGLADRARSDHDNDVAHEISFLNQSESAAGAPLEDRNRLAPQVSASLLPDKISY